jgi:hypothetical protein
MHHVPNALSSSFKNLIFALALSGLGLGQALAHHDALPNSWKDSLSRSILRLPQAPGM